MAGLVVADSDVLVDYLKAIDPGFSAVRQAIADERLVTTVISRFELRMGAQTPLQREVIGALLARLTVLPLDSTAAELAAEAGPKLERAGARLPLGDLLIAGIALAHGAALLTRNTRHFSRIPGVELEPL
ncbi:MAG: VapC toxin family PIN domain ribonuclease [Anaerolinea sp.]|nr:VapC toxin family PIN domain ribonuclease [Anaerolinea sp.]